MHKLTLQSILAVAILVTATTASAWWGSSNRGYGNSYDEWDPRYWAEEMEDFFGNDNNYGANYGTYGPRGFAPYGYAPQQAPYGYAPQQAPYGYAPQAPYGYAPQQ